MHTFATSTSDDEIKDAVVAWSELLAQKRFAEAIAMFPPADGAMSPDDLSKCIAGYGCPESYPDGRTFEVTSLRALPQFAEIFQNRIDVDRENLYGLDPRDYVGMVHYDDVPLNSQPSDLTARFHIKRVGGGRITLEFLDIHVM